MMATAGIRDIDQGISDSQLQCIVGVIFEEEDVDDVEEGLAERQEEEDRCCDVVEVLSDDVSGAAIDQLSHRAQPSVWVGGIKATKRNIVIEQSKGRRRSDRHLIEVDAIAEDIGNISEIRIIGRILISIHIQDLILINAKHSLVNFTHQSTCCLHEVGHLDDRSVAEDVIKAAT